MIIWHIFDSDREPFLKCDTSGYFLYKEVVLGVASCYRTASYCGCPDKYSRKKPEEIMLNWPGYPVALPQAVKHRDTPFFFKTSLL